MVNLCDGADVCACVSQNLRKHYYHQYDVYWKIKLLNLQCLHFQHFESE